jgi:superfamily II DNA or RNA helicase
VLSKEAKAFAQYCLKYANVSAKIFPNQEFVNASARGDYIELPLHLEHRKQHKTVFIDVKTNEPIKDQWKYLSEVKKLDTRLLKELIAKDQVANFDQEVLQQIVFPSFELKLFVYDMIYIPVINLSASFINTLKSMASFDNPQVKTLLALRKPLYNIPRVLRNYEEDETYLKLPRGLIYEIQALLDKNSVRYTLEDKKNYVKADFASVTYTLREEQNDAVNAILKTDFSICVAPPGFGKTLIGAKMIELRQSNTLVVVNKNMLLDQWRDRFVDYFAMNKKEIGFLGKGKNKLNGHLDVATMQSLKNAPDIIQNYSFVIVDECHHIPAVTFEQIIKGFTGKYILGLSATPNRKDGLQPILFQQLGPISYEFKKKRTLTHTLKVIRTSLVFEADNYAQLINELCENQERNELILEQIKTYESRKTLVLTDRIEHIKLLEALLKQNSIKYVSIHGSLSKKLQKENMEKVESSNLILATTSFFGEGIDFPHLNTIVFATPISYYGRLVQYLGRIGRDGQRCLAIDILDSRNAMLNSAYKKRLEGYTQMHYK